MSGVHSFPVFFFLGCFSLQTTLWAPEGPLGSLVAQLFFQLFDAALEGDDPRVWKKLEVIWTYRYQNDLDLIWLVVSTPLNNMKINWDDDIP